MLVGVYENSTLIKEYKTLEMTSEALPKIFKEILDLYECESVYFARGPGSFMSIKITYIFLKSLNISKGIKLFASDGFLFNDNLPIKAVGNLYFVKEGELIKTKKVKEPVQNAFYLPRKIDKNAFTKEIEPLYILPAV